MQEEITVKTLQRSPTADRLGIDNTPTEVVAGKLQYLISKVLEPMSMLFTYRITSGYRGKALNTKIGGATSSQHMKGEAADLVPTRISVKEAYDKIVLSAIPYDQVIYEKRGTTEWIHISYRRTKPRHQHFVLVL